jgi:hypothetical protein
MRFLHQIIGLVPWASHAGLERRPTRRRRAPIALETLEGRALLSGIAVSNGNLTITAATGTGGNHAEVQIDSANHFVEVTFNGQTQEFNPSTTPITSVLYLGGTLGGDTFADNTNLESREYGYATGNHFTGGTSYNYVWFVSGGGNSFSDQGDYAVSDVWGYQNSDTINNPGHAKIQLYTYL